MNGENGVNNGVVARAILALTNFMAAIPGYLHIRRWQVVAGTVIFTAFMGAGMNRLVLDQSMDSFFREDDPTIAGYTTFRYLFGSDENLMIMYQAPDGDIFSRDSLLAVKKLEDQLNQLKNDPNSPLHRITRIRSIITADYLENRGDLLLSRKFIGENIPQNQGETETLRELALAHNDYPGSFFTRDSKRGVITLQTDFGARVVQEEGAQEVGGEADFDFDAAFEEPAPQSSGAAEAQNSGVTYNGITIPQMEQPQMDAYGPMMEAIFEVLEGEGWYNTAIAGDEAPKDGVGYVIAGNPYIMNFFYEIMMNEIGLTMSLAILLILATLGIAFRSLSSMIWPTLIIVLSIVWTIGTMAWLGVAMSMMVQIVIFLNLTVGIAASIHILSGYKIYLKEGLPKEEALTMALRKSGIAIFLAALTTMGGLSSLMFVPIMPIRNFAIASTLGIFFTFVGAITLLPTLMTFRAPKHTNSVEKGGKFGANIEHFFQDLLHRIALFNETYPRQIVAIFLIIMIVVSFGAFRIKVDTNFTNEVKAGLGLRESYDAIDNFFGGAMNLEVLVDTGQVDGVKNPELLKAVDSFSANVLSERGDFAVRSFSAAKAAKESRKVLTDGSQANYYIPDDSAELSQVLFNYDSADPATRKLFVDDDWRTARVSFQVYNKSSHEYVEFIEDLEGRIEKEFRRAKAANPDLNVTLTGGVPLMMKMISFISYSQIKSFGLALVVVSAIMLLFFGSIKFGALAMLPNIFPIAVVAGAVGWSGVPLDTDTLLVMPIAIGIAVDDTIHFLTRYRTEILHGAKRKAAIDAALKEVGQAMMFTSLILSIGFLVFLTTSYIPLNKFGVLSAMAIFSALIADLLFLPALLMVFKPFKTVADE